MKINSSSAVKSYVELDPADQFLVKDGSVLITKILGLYDTFKDGTTSSIYLCEGLKRNKSGSFGSRSVHIPAVRKSDIPSAIRDAMVTEARKSIAVVLGRLDNESTQQAWTPDWNRVIEQEIR